MLTSATIRIDNLDSMEATSLGGTPVVTIGSGGNVVTIEVLEPGAARRLARRLVDLADGLERDERRAERRADVAHV